MRVNDFNPVAGAYSRTVAPYRFSQFLTLVHELALAGSERVLDVGSGPGELSLQLASRLKSGGFLLGIDLSTNMVRLARKNASNFGAENVAFKKGDGLKLEFEDESFDVVVSSNAFPWIPDRPKFLAEVFRVLKPGGRFGLVTLSSKCYREFSDVFAEIGRRNNGLFPEGKPFELMGAKLYSLGELRRTVGKAGFDVVRQFELTTRQPITAPDYYRRVNAIVHENYLDYIKSASRRQLVRNLLLESLAGRNGSLKVTESSVFVIGRKD
jgi:ubiquinone/menaquinone biosynthesis C-methylase UbiE